MDKSNSFSWEGEKGAYSWSFKNPLNCDYINLDDFDFYIADWFATSNYFPIALCCHGIDKEVHFSPKFPNYPVVEVVEDIYAEPQKLPIKLKLAKPNSGLEWFLAFGGQKRPFIYKCKIEFSLIEK